MERLICSEIGCDGAEREMHDFLESRNRANACLGSSSSIMTMAARASSWKCQGQGLDATASRDSSAVVDLLGADVPCAGLKHGLVEAAPNVLWRVDQVLDSASDAVDPRSGGDSTGGGKFGGFGGERMEDSVVHGGDVGRYGVTRVLHEDNGVGRVDEIMVAVPGGG
ncbi:hypothetical protein Acr_00g0069340 [Actinidia rufa]|uniref:Uncharacterized protein n=1 Tax=Actinidia rufa TaxID=165716 RepID=A0A7J0DR37_9ERIC|nr:hypothetical protein Acr_00g0069340 [Actinidia rufa]